MFLLRRSIDECIAVFKQLAKRVFLPRQSFGIALFAKISSFLSSLLTDSLYRAAKMEVCLKEAFRLDALFSSIESNVGISRPKVAVTTMAVSNSSLCILSNYNGAGVRQGESLYPVFRYTTNKQLQATNTIELLTQIIRFLSATRKFCLFS
jgi:hypothetical protein